VSAQPARQERRQWTPLARALGATGDQLTLPIVLQLSSGALRHSQLHSLLPGISTGVLNRHLQHMVAVGLLARRRFREMPPRVEYELTDSGRELLPIVGALARWGMRRVWSAPQSRELVDLGELLRLLPALLADTHLPQGIVEMVVEHTERPARQIFDIDRGRLAPVNGSVIVPWARIEGPPGAWIAALGPTCASERLRIVGDEQLARCILDALPNRR